MKIEKIAEILNVQKEEVALAMDANASNVVTSINEPVYNEKSGKKVCVEDMIPDENNEETDITNKLTISKLIEELNEQERDIVKLRYFNGKTQTEVAKKLGISQVQVSRIEKRILHSMKQKLVI